MKFGLTFVPVFPLGFGQSQALAEILDQAKAAKKGGFNSLWAAQHHVTDTEQMFQPLPLLARFSGDFPGMVLGTSSLLLSLLHPVDVAEQTANLDILSGGKFILGVSLGYRAKEFEAFNLDKARRVGRFVESVEIVRRLWAQERFSFEGKFFNFEDVSINPKPVQKNGPEIWIGADTEKGAERAGEIGDAWMISPRQSIGYIRKLLAKYRQATRRKGRGDGKLLLMRELHVAKKKADALRNAEPYLKQMYNTYLKWGQPGERYDLSFEELSQGRYIVGDPATCIEELSKLEKELRPEQISFRMTWPGMKHTDVMDSIKLFGEKVIPHFR